MNIPDLLRKNSMCMMPICPKCESHLFSTEVLKGCDISDQALACTNPKCDFLVCDNLGEFLYED